jgi:protocatechuate 3,4-dioxygenase beta subunit
LTHAVNEHTITDTVIATTANASDARLREIVTSLVRHLHDFVRDVELQPHEWMTGIDYLTRTGQKCDALRQEFILLSDTLGVTMLIDALANRKTSGATESTVLGPFFTTDAPDIAHGASIASPGKGFPLIVRGRLTNTAGAPLAGAVLEVWETDGDGQYDTQYAERHAPDCRGRIRTAADGTFAFRGVLPVSYPVPTDGPVGELLRGLGRHAFRPAHLHVMIAADGHVPVATAIYAAGDAYIDSDAVFGVKASLVETFVRHDSPDEAQANNVTAPFYTLDRDFVLEPSRV